MTLQRSILIKMEERERVGGRGEDILLYFNHLLILFFSSICFSVFSSFSALFFFFSCLFYL